MTTNKNQSTTDVPPLPWQEVCESSDWWINTADEAAFDGGWVCDSNPGVFRNQATLDFMLKAANAYPILAAALNNLTRWHAVNWYRVKDAELTLYINEALDALESVGMNELARSVEPVDTSASVEGTTS